MAQTILLARGLFANLPLEAVQGMPLWTTDTNELFFGDGVGNSLIKATQGVEDLIVNDYVPNTKLGATDGVATLSGDTVLWSQLPVSDATVASSTTLWSSEKINTMLTAGVAYLGHWDASLNSPSVQDETGTNGDYYIVATAGTIDLSVAQDGSNTLELKVGDNIIYTDPDGDGAIAGKWERSINSNNIQTVNGESGVVILNCPHLFSSFGYWVINKFISRHG